MRFVSASLNAISLRPCRMAQSALCPEISFTPKYKKYHTDVKLAERLGILPQRLRLIIPRSTRLHWRNEDDPDDFLVMDSMTGRKVALVKDIKDESLLRQLEMLKRVNFVLRNLIREMKSPKQILAEKKAHIVRIIHRFSPLCGRKMVLRAFGISNQQFHYWARNIHKCASTFSELCRVKHPFQLTLSEIKKFIKYLKDPRFACWSRISIYYRMLRDGVIAFGKSTFYA